MRKIIIFVLVLILSGCVSSNLQKNSLDNADNELTKGDIQNLTWKKPIVQLVKVPATIRNGVYMPEHYEYVIIRPGEYILNVEPLTDKKIIAEEKVRKLYQIPQHVKVISPSGGDSVVVCFYSHPLKFKNENEYKIINIQEKPFLLQNLKECYALHEKEPVDLKNRSYAFKYDDSKVVIYWANESNMIKKAIESSSEVFFNREEAIMIKSLGGK